MSFLPDSATFHERVQACFVAYRGRGVALSAKDVDLLDEWARAEVPFEVVARGIRRAAEVAAFDAVEGETLMSLRGCKRQVDSEIQKFVKRSIGKGAPEDTQPLHLARHQKLTAALKKFAKENEGFRRLLTIAQQLPEPADLAAADRQEHLVNALLIRASPPEVRARVLTVARRHLLRAMPVSRAARLEALRFHRSAVLRGSLDVPNFW